MAPNGKSAANTSATASTQSGAAEASAQVTTGVVDTSRKQPDAKIAAARATNASADNDPTVRRSSQQQARGARARAGKSVDAPDARAELALVERMQAAMRAGEASEALALCAEHSKRWPSGVFVEEREAVRAIASCTLRSDDALERAQVFLRKYPRAPMAPRVAAACPPLTAATRVAAPRK
jgi:hypothetical protein